MLFADIEEIYEKFLSCTGVSTDSRKVAEGQMFIALSGDNFDGNDYVTKAIDSGAKYALSDNVDIAKTNENILYVENCLSSLQQLATYHRVRLNTPMIAISGSNGKTTTKELISRVLSAKFNIVVTQGNFNNHIGVPLTLLRLTEQTQFAVVEMGANHQKEIELLCSIARPNCGLLTNIGRAHLEGFGGVEGVKKGKGELFDYLNTHQGIIFYNSNNQVISDLAKARECAIKIAFDDSKFTKVDADKDGFLQLELEGKSISTKLIGDYNRYNIIAAIAVGDFFGISLTEAINAIEGYVPDNNRSQRIVTKRNTVVADLYNANPSSMEAALRNFATVECDCKKVLILGDMMELGEYSSNEHQRINDLVQELGFVDVYYIGHNFLGTTKNKSAKFFADVNQLSDYLKDNKIVDSEIMLKASRSIGLEKILELL